MRRRRLDCWPRDDVWPESRRSRRSDSGRRRKGVCVCCFIFYPSHALNLLCCSRLRAEEEQRRQQEARERQERAAREAEEERRSREEERRSREEEERRQKERRWKDMQEQLDKEVRGQAINQ